MSNQERIHKSNVETVQRMKAQGMTAQTIIDMEPRLQAAVEEVFAQTRHDISNTADANAEMRIDMAKYAMKYVGGSGAAESLPSIADAIL